MLQRITVSFKVTKKEKALYERVKDLEEQSQVVKDALEMYFRHIDSQVK